MLKKEEEKSSGICGVDCILASQFSDFRKELAVKDKEDEESRNEYRRKQDEMYTMIKTTHSTVHGNGDKDKGLVGQLQDLNLGVYGDKKNKVCGLIDILDYKSDLKLIRWLRKRGSWLAGTAVVAYVSYKIKTWIGWGGK